MRTLWNGTVLCIALAICASLSLSLSHAEPQPETESKSDSGNQCSFFGCAVYPRDLNEDAVTQLLSVIRGGDELDSDPPKDDPVDPVDAQSRMDGISTLNGCGAFALEADEDNQHASRYEHCLMDRATLTLTGFKGQGIVQINQDRGVIVSPFLYGTHSHHHGDSTSSTDFLVGTFDGHGNTGELVSQHTATNLPALLSQKLTTLENLLDSKVPLTEAQVRTILLESFRQMDIDAPNNGEGGSTCSIVLRLGEKLYFANAGDSRTFLASVTTGSGSSESTNLEYITAEHKPDLPEEKLRVEKAGGRVNIPGNGGTPRVIAKNGRNGLAMSRSIGDWQFTGVIPDPAVDVIDLSKFEEECAVDAEGTQTCAKKEFIVVSATDGMFDEIGPNDIARIMAGGFYNTDNKYHPITMAEALVEESAERWGGRKKFRYRDDIAIAALRIH